MKKASSLFLSLALVAGAYADASPKRGICFNNITPADLAALSPGVSWAYNWGVGKPDAFNDPRAKGVEFLPMAWGPQQGFRDHLEAFLTTGPKPSAVLGLNEPNLREQAFQSPEEAAKSWRELDALCKRHGVRLVAPHWSMGSPEAASWRGFDPVQGKEVVHTFFLPYLDTFEWYLREAGPEKPAAMGLHVYGNIWELRWIVGELAKRYPATPIWITEFNWFDVPDGRAFTCGAFGSDYYRFKASLVNPSGETVASKDVVSDSFWVDVPHREGHASARPSLWRIDFARARQPHYDWIKVDLSGVPGCLFLTRGKTWSTQAGGER